MVGRMRVVAGTILVMCALGAQDVRSQQADGPSDALESDWVALQARLQHRDQAFQSAYLPYTVDSIVSPPSYKAPLESLPSGPAASSALETGWWVMDGDRFAFQREYSRDGEVRQVHLTWDTKRASILHVQPALLDQPEEASRRFQFPSLLTIHEHPVQPAKHEVAYFPDQFGLVFNGERWTEWLKATTDVKVLGREDVDGVDCLVVVLDVVGPGNEDDGEYILPSIVWFDDKHTLLARKRVAYLHDPEGAPNKPRLGPSRVLGERRFRPYASWTLVDARQINGAWIPTAGEYRGATMHGDWKVSVRVGDDATFNGGFPADCFEIDPPAGTRRS